MYLIYMKKINGQGYPIAHSQQVVFKQDARKYRSLDKVIADWEQCIVNYPNYLWQVRDYKTLDIIKSNSHDILPRWNKQLGVNYD